ncbi:uncharacterized protein JN550_006066 [Neoarthrinium moseri]|uniref:uncharacterized protein n=1 Tax=Neoarthrinium moseri TaxID=1658444 RepID=UPI001FDC6A06|nr:uncharacterized protein JN550_006066 [Neoarthrinium moseri]KAI1869079.1 hypothetical protein JN550_006066 [Neoarthrinium moseri]
MTESAPAPEDAAAARAAEQARLRKERREAKIKAGGAARLNKITGLGGREPEPTAAAQPASQTPPPQATPRPPKPASSSHDDPEEVDISQHYYAPRTAAGRPQGGAGEPALSEAQLRQMMLGLDRPGATPPGRNPFFDPSAGGGGAPGDAAMPPGMEGLANDPMMQMMQQMMGGGAGGGPGANPFAGTGMESLFAGMAGGAGPEGAQAQTQAAVTDKSANVWRILHAVFALGLGLYIALSTTFAGTRAERDFGSSLTKGGDAGAEDPAAMISLERKRAYFFYVFTSIEAVLLTTRYFLDKRRAPPTGIVWTVSGFLPGRLGSGVRHALRYGEIFSTVRSDALVCVFVLGVCCWLRS